MKKIMTIVGVVALAAACVGCGNNEEPKKPAETTTAVPSPTGIPDTATLTSEVPATPTEVPTNTPTPTPAPDENGMYAKCPSNYLVKRAGVEYGSFVHGTYYSEYCGRERGYTVMLPPGYTEEKKYPVIYLLHGIFGDENSFAGDASNQIPALIGNMIADGLCEEFILVCPAMFAASDETVQAPGFTGEAMVPYDRFPKELVDCLIRILTRRTRRSRDARERPSPVSLWAAVRRFTHFCSIPTGSATCARSRLRRVLCRAWTCT